NEERPDEPERERENVAAPIHERADGGEERGARRRPHRERRDQPLEAAGEQEREPGQRLRDPTGRGRLLAERWIERLGEAEAELPPDEVATGLGGGERQPRAEPDDQAEEDLARQRAEQLADGRAGERERQRDRGGGRSARLGRERLLADDRHRLQARRRAR